jgi:hypothetical protein
MGSTMFIRKSLKEFLAVDKLSQKSEDVVWHPSGYDAGYREEERDNTTITITIRANPSNPGKTAPN